MSIADSFLFWSAAAATVAVAVAGTAVAAADVAESVGDWDVRSDSEAQD